MVQYYYTITNILNFLPEGLVKYDIVHMRDQVFSKQPLNEFGSLPKNDP